MVDPAYLVGIGGAIGAVCRYLVGEAIPTESFPFGTLLVNVVGSFVLGFVTFLGIEDDLLLLVGTGACGAFTTYSSFSFDTVRLWETGRPYRSVAYAAANVVGALIAIGLAWVASGLMTSGLAAG